MTSAPLLAVDGLGRRLGGRMVLAELGFTLAPGEALGITGASGAGKSTLARLLARLETPDAGTISFEDTQIGAIPPERFARHPLRGAIQLVLQEARQSLAPRLAAADAIAAPLATLAPERGPELGPEARAARVREAAQRAHLPLHLLGRLPHALSQGQAARVALARALISRPRLLILDETLAPLDAAVQAGLLLTLDRLRAEGVAIILVSHDLHPLRLLCGRLLVLDAGRIVAQGAPAALISAPPHPAMARLAAAMPGPPQPR
jgi:peptide/nickel transport system ATP-binding protein